MPRSPIYTSLPAIGLAALFACSSQTPKPQSGPPAMEKPKLQKIHVTGSLRNKRGKPLSGKSLYVAPLLKRGERITTSSFFDMQGKSAMPQGQSQADGQFTIDVDRDFVEILKRINQGFAASPDPASKGSAYDLQQFALVTLDARLTARELQRAGQPARITIDWSAEEVNLGDIVF